MSGPDASERIDRARAALREARSVVVLTGAGISAESGVPTFRGAGGLWKTWRPEELATPFAFERDPKLVWEWYDWRRQKIAQAEPNPGHLALVEMERRFPEFLLVTQNVDGLHFDAGSRKLVEMHGSIWRMKCVACLEAVENREVPLPALPPKCRCGGLLRPDVVWFGELLPPDALNRATRACQNCDVMLIVGTSSVVYPAASLGPAAVQGGAQVFEINVEPTDLSPYYTVLQGKAGEVLPELM